MRPGVTGLWQVSGRNEVTYNERVSMDSTYYNSVSLGTDLRILAKTADAVLSKTGC
ncbi:MAG: sugar transferase [Pseudomonadota bacterium]